MDYREKKKTGFCPAEFRNPGADCRGVPFWAWNCRMTREMIAQQIDMFRMMGFGGVFIHSRTGMEIEYLSEAYMDLVAYAKQECDRQGLRVWLYDEDRWPSGSAGGKVTRDGEYAAEYLLFTHRKYGECENAGCKARKALLPGRGGCRHENGTLLGTFDIRLNEDGRLEGFQLYQGGEVSGELWYAYLEHAIPSAWFNNATYINVLDADAVQRFAEVTYDAYYGRLGDSFGRDIPAIFTDEPQHVYMNALVSTQEKNCVFLPWSRNFAESFRKKNGYDIFWHLPEIVFESGSERYRARYDYHNHVADLFAENFCGTLARWCRSHHIMLTGHLMWEPTLQSQTTFIGDAMRCYPWFDLPGMDILADAHEYNTAKQVQSVSHQMGAPGVISEMYGKSGWNYDFRGHKLQGDWQAALGVTVRVPHLSWASMKGEAKRDYPATISDQSPWWQRYPLIEDHFARVSMVMTRGKADVHVGVIHPMESMYLHWGPESQTAWRRSVLDQRFAHLTELLLFEWIDFDFICEATLPAMNACSEDGVRVGQMDYDILVVPGCETLRETTVSYLQKCIRAGKKVLFLGECPGLVNGTVPQNDSLPNLYAQSERVAFEDFPILEKLGAYRFAECRNDRGIMPDYLLHQVRKDGDDIYVFIARGKNPDSPDEDPREQLTFTFRGEFSVEELNTATGEIFPLPSRTQNGRTILCRQWFLHDSLLLRLTKRRSSECAKKRTSAISVPLCRPELTFAPARIALEEPNALLLDLAEFALDDAPYRPVEELLRLDNQLRKEIGLPRQTRDVVQPYCMRDEVPAHVVRLRFRFRSEIDLRGAKLALENPENAQIWLNGAPVISQPDGWYVDRSMETVPLPDLRLGENIIELTIPFGKNTFTEWCYLLGDFGVRAEGIHKTILPPVRRAVFGNLVPQGLPFYTGNLTYSYRFRAEGDVLIRVPRYRGACLSARVDGGESRDITLSPYAAKFEGLAEGEHVLELKLYNTRQNGFGPLHHTNSIRFEQHPDAWRSTGDRWTYEYQLEEFGILSSPEIYRIEVANGGDCYYSG